jgi:hypothetical protein
MTQRSTRVQRAGAQTLMTVALMTVGLILGSCSSAAPNTPSSAPSRAGPTEADPRQTPSEARFQTCAAEGGEMRQQGRMGAWACVTLYADAGKVCRDKSDCLGKCEAVRGDTSTTSAPKPAEETGICAADNSRFGCRAEIIKGRSTAWLCID